jgi:hypothetical protein
LQKHHKAHTLSNPSFIITPKYSAALRAHPSIAKITAAIDIAIAYYQNSLTSVGSADILFDTMPIGLGKIV